MIDRIKALEKVARLLEPSPDQRQAVREQVISYTESFLDQLERVKTYIEVPDKGAALLQSPISEDPLDAARVLDLVRRNVDTPGINPASGGHLGYIPGGGIYYSSLADYMAAVTNRYAGIFFASPGAVRMENMLIRWMAGIMGYPDEASGNLASGGSIANLIAIVAAREARGIRARDVERSPIYLTDQAHHCVDKAIRIAGLRECPRRIIPRDDRYRMNAGELEQAVRRDRESGLNPWLVIASAGTVDVGAIDPLDSIADCAKRNNLWFHVDGAYGAFFVLTEAGKKRLGGIERSDSVVMDPHKGLFLPYGLGVVLVRDRAALHRAHHYHAPYMQDANQSMDEPSPAELSPELTKHFRGLRMWMPLKLLGVKPFRAALEEKLLLAQYFHEEIQKFGFEVGPPPELSVVTFRFRDKSEALLKAMLEDGRVFLSSTMLDGRFTLRLAVLSFRTHLDTVQMTLQMLREKVKAL